MRKNRIWRTFQEKVSLSLIKNFVKQFEISQFWTRHFGRRVQISNNQSAIIFYPYAKHCLLLIDEMAIVPGNFFDPATKQYIGYANFRTSTGEERLTSHIPVFILGGIGARWKQTVAYFFTSDSVNGRELKPVVIGLLKRWEKRGLCVQGITWVWWTKLFGRSSTSIRQDIQKLRTLLNIHAIKLAGFLNNKIIRIPDEFVLSSEWDIKLFWVYHPNSNPYWLNAEDISAKWKLETQTIFLAPQLELFLSLLEKQHKHMNMLLPPGSSATWLNGNTRVGEKGQWRPFQTGILITTKSVIEKKILSLSWQQDSLKTVWRICSLVLVSTLCPMPCKLSKSWNWFCGSVYGKY